MLLFMHRKRNSIIHYDEDDDDDDGVVLRNMSNIHDKTKFTTETRSEVGPQHDCNKRKLGLSYCIINS